MKRKTVIIVAVILVILAGVLGGTAAYMKNVTDTTSIFAGVQIEGMELGGMSEEEAQKKLDEYWAELLKTKITVKVEKETKKISLKNLGLKYTNEDIVKEAYGIGREGNFIKNYFTVKGLVKNPKNLTLTVEFDDAVLTETLKEKTKDLETGVKNATLKRENGQFIIEKESDGIAIDYKASKAALKEKIASGWEDRAAFEVEMTTKVEKAKYTEEMMKEVNDKLGSYSTNYSSSAWGRKKNVKAGASFINGSLLYPGEEFSVYEAVAPFTYDRGYELAGSYLNGKTIQSMGGGICQVSTTLYNAVLRAELEITERHPHSMTVAYVPLSADAAISGTYKDLKFKNNTDYPIYIEGYGNGSTLSFTIWGKETRDPDREISFKNEVLSSTPSKEKEIKDPTLEEGKREVVSKGHTGYKAKLWKIVTENGVQTDKILVNSSSYSASVTEVRVGTKKPEVTTEEKPETTTSGESETTTAAQAETTTAAQTETTEAQTETTEAQEETAEE